MNFPGIEDFVLIPEKGNTGKARLYELKKSGALSQAAFVIIPYKNPTAGKADISAFKIINTRTVDLAPPVTIDDKKVITLLPVLKREEYLSKISKLKAHIQRGDIYEINYCINFLASGVEIDPHEVFARLHQIARAPYAMLVKTGAEWIISASPELFLKKTGNNISSKPIKGTAPRGKNPVEDDELRSSLENSVKERTENVMAVDVARNDLSRFAKKGTVGVNKLYNIETFETVHQMVSTVSCEAKEGTAFETIIDCTFPMASMTGAPKIRAMQLIDELEDFTRNNYSGAMGFIEKNGDFELSVIIRSIFYNEKTHKVSIAVGGAITYLSEAEKEYEECLLKARALLAALGARIEK